MRVAVIERREPLELGPGHAHPLDLVGALVDLGDLALAAGVCDQDRRKAGCHLPAALVVLVGLWWRLLANLARPGHGLILNLGDHSGVDCWQMFIWLRPGTDGAPPQDDAVASMISRMDEGTNPAHRLYVILSGLRDGAASGLSLRDSWCTVLNVDPTNQDEFEVRKASVGSLIVDLRGEILALRGIINTTSYLRYMSQWTAIINDPPARSGSGFKPEQVCTEDSLQVLSSFADILNARAPEIEPSPEAVDDLLLRVTELVEAVTRSDDLSPAFRMFLLRQLAAFDNALRTVRIRGQRGLDEVLGRVMYDANRQKTAWSNFTNHQLFNKFKLLLKALTMLATASDDIAKITSNVQEMYELEGPQGPQDLDG
jgi:hypothetical protein